MHFQEHEEGGYRIFAGAVESSIDDGYTAAIVVQRKPGASGTAPEAYRDERLAGGHRWASPEEALRYALHEAQRIIRNKPGLLHC